MSFVAPAFDLHAQDFRPGLLDSPESDALPIGATPDAANCAFDRIGQIASLKKRNGHRLLNPMVLPARVDGAVEFTRPGFPPELIAVSNGLVWKYAAGTTSWLAVSGGSGFTAGNPASFVVFRTQLYIFDGTQQLRYNGTACLPIGFDAPTSVTDMTAVAPAVTGRDGTFEAFYVWYDSVSDHESSPSPTTGLVILTLDARQHTKPGGSPPANVDKWRAYVRRTDTYEANFFLAGTFLITDATGNEETSDTARREIGPLETSNDPPPDSFRVMTAWRGYVLGIKPDDFNLYFSKQGDGQSWHPKEVFPVRAGGRDLRSAKVFGTDCLVQTPRRTFHLVGTRVPFAIEELSSEWGNVGADSGVEVGKHFYAWDEQRGPYRTDTLTWEALADNRIENLLETVNRAELASIRAEIFPKQNLVIWMVATGTQTRARTLLAYDYLLDSWLPPITGFEYSALTRFTDTLGETGFYIGDEWGRVYELLSGLVDGPPSGTLVAVVTSATPSSVTCAGAAFYTTGNGLAGMPVACLSPSGVLQWRRIRSNNASAIFLDVTNDNPWTTVPQPNPDSFDDGGSVWDTAIWDDATWTASAQQRRPGDWLILVGGINWYFTTPVFHGNEPDVMKRGAYLMLQGRATSSDDTVIAAEGRFNDEGATSRRHTFIFSVRDRGAVWDEAVWDVNAWGGGSSSDRKTRKRRIGRTFHAVQYRFSNPYPNQDFTLVGYRITADRLPRRRGRNV